ncbi:TPA: elongation factor P [Candidatus Dependentiae bacterium]|nr:MAG: Elongation factor P [candidate division TM6 bacterium GW2011_GWF2_36_131]KKQ03691.1 MAG: Elongation factor P [candidate division TM6 bacterium GW2011_GWE2_36_25]KKQ20073.1 MAG: Elongation factor P [candidate division TM6 bacterium GW2011_GWA2_36_9]HBR70458.1 elongation factor P [Candidatus Dependentiae bacterium]HCU00826.1 elongation factor P [Candidatus Dependentiae bacterium]
MITAGDFRKGTKFLYNGEPHVVVTYQHVKPGKGGAFMRTKMRNMITGSIYEETFRTEEKFEVPDLKYRDMQYLYQDGEEYHFMDQEDYDQVVLNKSHLEEVLDLLKEETIYSILYFQDKPIDVAAPLFMELKVIDSPPGVRGDTAQGSANKSAILETGLRVQVPLFVEEGDCIKVDTRNKSYIERVKK